ncbi:hypothetical protein [Sulfurimonas sp.]|uniref:hypothetical protein n=1 Tax=Sulfurimonas sp. TaxID=2022749 RepID=UPI0025FC6EF2|nr:hypothetical protein [Sulfurimonas sp.]MBW6487547.1 hypothetical protein [Sulfurimonas sp.]
MIKVAFFASLVLSSIFALEDLGTYGATHSIKEENFINKVEKHAKDLNTSLIQDQFYLSQKEFLNIKKLLPTCTESKKRFFTPTFIVPADIVLPNGKVIARAGEVMNTLDVMKKNNIVINKYMMFIDAEDPIQVQLSYRYKNQGFTYITNGSIEEYEKITTTKAFKADFLTIGKFDAKCVPSIIIQDGNQMAVYEYKPDDLVESATKDSE